MERICAAPLRSSVRVTSLPNVRIEARAEVRESCFDFPSSWGVKGRRAFLPPRRRDSDPPGGMVKYDIKTKRLPKVLVAHLSKEDC